MKTINIEYLVKQDFSSDEILIFAKYFNTDIDVKKILEVLISANDTDKLLFANKLLLSIFNRTQCIKYAIHAAELARPYAQKKYLEVIDNAINAAKNCLENDSEENRMLAKKACDAANATANASATSAAAYAAAYADASAASAAAYAAYYDTATANAAASYAAAFAAGNAASNAFYAANDAISDGVYKKTMIKIINYGLTLLEE